MYRTRYSQVLLPRKGRERLTSSNSSRAAKIQHPSTLTGVSGRSSPPTLKIPNPEAETDRGSGVEETWKRSRMLFEPAKRVTTVTPNGANQAVELAHQL
jgi:hypothetical protein